LLNEFLVKRLEDWEGDWRITLRYILVRLWESEFDETKDLMQRWDWCCWTLGSVTTRYLAS
jgi:hypothetical protein